MEASGPLRPGTISRLRRRRGVQETDAAPTDIEHGILVHHLFLSCTVELPLRLTFLYMKGRTPGAKMVQDASRPVRYNNN